MNKNGTETERKLHNILIKRRLTTSVLCTRVVITSGAWTPRIFSTLFPKSSSRLPMSSLASHSVLVRNPCYDATESDKEVCHAVFAADSLGFSPEWFSRIGGELYLAGLNTAMMPLPELATDVKVVDEAITKMKQCAAEMINVVDGKSMEVLRESLVHSPSSPAYWLLDTNKSPVLPSCINQWSSPCLPCARRKAWGWNQDSRGKSRRSLHSSWSRCLGYFTSSRNWICHG
jgi:hypothetical protein